MDQDKVSSGSSITTALQSQATVLPDPENELRPAHDQTPDTVQLNPDNAPEAVKVTPKNIIAPSCQTEQNDEKNAPETNVDREHTSEETVTRIECQNIQHSVPETNMDNYSSSEEKITQLESQKDENISENLQNTNMETQHFSDDIVTQTDCQKNEDIPEHVTETHMDDQHFSDDIVTQTECLKDEYVLEHVAETNMDEQHSSADVLTETKCQTDENIPEHVTETHMDEQHSANQIECEDKGQTIQENGPEMNVDNCASDETVAQTKCQKGEDIPEHVTETNMDECSSSEEIINQIKCEENRQITQENIADINMDEQQHSSDETVTQSERQTDMDKQHCSEEIIANTECQNIPEIVSEISDEQQNSTEEIVSNNDCQIDLVIKENVDIEHSNVLSDLGQTENDIDCVLPEEEPNIVINTEENMERMSEIAVESEKATHEGLKDTPLGDKEKEQNSRKPRGKLSVRDSFEVMFAQYENQDVLSCHDKEMFEAVFTNDREDEEIVEDVLKSDFAATFSTNDSFLQKRLARIQEQEEHKHEDITEKHISDTSGDRMDIEHKEKKIDCEMDTFQTVGIVEKSMDSELKEEHSQEDNVNKTEENLPLKHIKSDKEKDTIIDSSVEGDSISLSCHEQMLSTKDEKGSDSQVKHNHDLLHSTKSEEHDTIADIADNSDNLTTDKSKQEPTTDDSGQLTEQINTEEVSMSNELFITEDEDEDKSASSDQQPDIVNDLIDQARSVLLEEQLNDVATKETNHCPVVIDVTNTLANEDYVTDKNTRPRDKNGPAMATLESVEVANNDPAQEIDIHNSEKSTGDRQPAGAIDEQVLGPLASCNNSNHSVKLAPGLTDNKSQDLTTDIKVQTTTVAAPLSETQTDTECLAEDNDTEKRITELNTGDCDREKTDQIRSQTEVQDIDSSSPFTSARSSFDEDSTPWCDAKTGEEQFRLDHLPPQSLSSQASGGGGSKASPLTSSTSLGDSDTSNLCGGEVKKNTQSDKPLVHNDPDDLQGLVETLTPQERADCQPLKEFEDWRNCWVCFTEKMATLGVRSSSLETFVAKSSLTLGSLCVRHKDKGLRRQQTDPGPSDPETRSIRIVRMSSFDSGHDNGGTDLNQNKTDILSLNESSKNEQGDTSVANMDTMIIHDSVVHSESSPSTNAKTDNTEDKVASCSRITIPEVKNRAPPETEDAMFSKLLFNFGEKLESEHKKRVRAEDWADFLTVELDAHIESRTQAEERQVILRQRLIDLAGKHRRLKAEYKTLLGQINDLALDDDAIKPSDAAVSTKNKPLLRRNRSTMNRENFLAKRNAMLIRGSCRKSSSGDSGEDSVSEAATAACSAETRGKVEPSPIKNAESPPKVDIRNVSDVKRKWENSFRRKQEAHAEKWETKAADRGACVDTSVDLSELVAQTTGATASNQEKLHRELAAYDKYTKPSSGTSSPKTEVAQNGTRTPDNGDKQVNVKAFTSMWEHKLSKVPFETMTSTPRKDLAQLLDSGKSQVPTITEDAPIDAERDGLLDALLDYSDDFEQMDNIESSSGADHLSDLILTDSVSAKDGVSLWENMSFNSSASSASEPQKQLSGLNFSFSGSINQARAKFQGARDENPDDAMLSIPTERSTEFSDLKSRFEKK